MTRARLPIAFVSLLVPPAWAADPPPRELPLAAVQMRLIEEGRWLPIDLPTALRLATAKNLDLLAARARFAEVRGTRNEALGNLFPELTGSFTAGHIDGRIQASFGELADRSFSTLIPAGSVELRVNPGQVIFDALAAHRSLAAAEQDVAQVTQDVLATVARRYFGLQEAQARVKIAEEALAASRELARIAAGREQRGVGLTLDVKRAEARVAADEGQLAEARRAMRDASVALAVVLKLDPAVTLFPAETVVRQRTFVDLNQSVDALTRRAMAARPDLAAQARRVSAAEDSRRGVWAGALGPTVYGAFQESAIGRSIGDLGERQIYGGFVGFRLSPASVGRVQAAAARVEQARVQTERLEQAIAADLIAAREEALAATERIEAAWRGLQAAEAAQQISQARFEGGVGIGLDVLDAQAALAQARTDLVGAIVVSDAAQVELLRALGELNVEALLDGGARGGEP